MVELFLTTAVLALDDEVDPWPVDGNILGIIACLGCIARRIQSPVGGELPRAVLISLARGYYESEAGADFYVVESFTLVEYHIV